MYVGGNVDIIWLANFSLTSCLHRPIEQIRVGYQKEQAKIPCAYGTNLDLVGPVVWMLELAMGV